MLFFSVIIPLFNKADYISECLKSVLNQNFEDYEIIIMNDGSTDSSVSIVEEFTSDKINLFHQENLGVSMARNNAALFAKGKFLAFLDADDLWKSTHLEALQYSILKFKDAGLYCTNYEINYNGYYTTSAKFNFNLSDKPEIIADFFKASLKDTVAWTSATAISKDKFLSLGMFNKEYTTGQDLDLWIRIALTENIVFNPKITMVYNKSIQNSLSKTELNDIRFRLLNSYKAEEEKNKSLKQYLDLKRYGLTLRSKINGETRIYKDSLKTIDFNNLNLKQRLLLKTPTSALRFLNKLRPFVIKNKWYLLIFKG